MFHHNLLTLPEIKAQMVLMQEVEASTPEANADFSFGISISGDLLAVGAYNSTESAIVGAGSAYIFKTSDGGQTWSFQEKIAIATPQADESLGYGLVINGDLLAVGAYGYDTTNVDEGAVYIYKTSDGGASWSHQQTIQASNKSFDSRFGQFLDLDGDLLVVGASTAVRGGISRAGEAYVFKTSDGGASWTEQQILTPSDSPFLDDLYGRSVAISGNLLVVGSSSIDGGSSGEGAVYVFKTSDGGASWTEQQKIVSPSPQNLEQFGYAASMDGDLIVISSPTSDVDAVSNTGAAWVYKTVDSGATWTFKQKLTASDGLLADLAGITCAISGGLVVLGASGKDPNGQASGGGAYISKSSDNGETWIEQDILELETPVAQDNFGRNVAVDGDLVAVGARFRSTGANTDNGAAYVYKSVGVVV